MHPLVIISWLSVIRQGFALGREVYSIIKGPGGSERVERYRRFNQAMKHRKEKEDAKIQREVGNTYDSRGFGDSPRAF